MCLRSSVTPLTSSSEVGTFPDAAPPAPKDQRKPSAAHWESADQPAEQATGCYQSSSDTVVPITSLAANHLPPRSESRQIVTSKARQRLHRVLWESNVRIRWRQSSHLL